MSVCNKIIPDLLVSPFLADTKRSETIKPKASTSTELQHCGNLFLSVFEKQK